ncbi:MAG: hypothetical protein M3309_06325 [Actinomycetota bacterium]|nr:hypothetical protein [Actinomycetota bacterium]
MHAFVAEYHTIRDCVELEKHHTGQRQAEKLGRRRKARGGKIFSGFGYVRPGLVLALGGFLEVFIEGGITTAPNVTAGAVGAMLGVMGYALGARRLAAFAVILSVVVLFFGLAASEGLIPGIEGCDRGLPDQEPGS